MSQHETTNGQHDDCRVGSIRPSQLLWTYGPGAMIDLPNFSVMTMGLDYWKKLECLVIQEPRLLAYIRQIGLHKVQDLRQPPLNDQEQDDLHDARSYRGVPVQLFPRWLRCSKCSMIAPYDIGLFNMRPNPFRPELTRIEHVGCGGDALPIRFLVACKCGHIDDFPWRWFVHGGAMGCHKKMYLKQHGAALQPDNMWIECECGAKISMASAFGKAGQKSLPCCRAHHPHLGYDDDSYGDQPCKERLRTIVLGATNSWFPATVSTLAIPTRKNELAQEVADNWASLKDIPNEQILDIFMKSWAGGGQFPELLEHTAAEIWAAIEEERKPKEEKPPEDVKTPEWNELISENPKNEFPKFQCRKGTVPPGFEDKIAKVRLLDRLRKVNALVGFTRIEARDDFAEDKSKVKLAPLCKGDPEWVPACEVFGEGIFLQFDETALAAWEKVPAVVKRAGELHKVYTEFRRSRGIDEHPEEGFPGARFFLLHTVSHLLIREFSLECGYNAASLQERIYSRAGEKPMAGILIYTAAMDSDGTLGGLVAMGEPDRLGPVLAKALARARTCSSDPLCSEHRFKADGSLHGAACHACTFAAETSCEAGNKYLDRAFVVPTYAVSDVAFFGGEVTE